METKCHVFASRLLMRRIGWLTACTSCGSVRWSKLCSSQEVNQTLPPFSVALSPHTSRQPGTAQPLLRTWPHCSCCDDCKFLGQLSMTGRNCLTGRNSCACVQSVSTSDAAAEAAVFSHADTEPGEAAAAGPPPAQTLQLRQWQHSNNSHSQSGSLWFPRGSDSKSGSTSVTEQNWICRKEEIVILCFVYLLF